MNNIIPGRDGLPDIKKEYSDEEKIIIAAKAEDFGAKPVASAYGIKWQQVVSWKRMLRVPPSKPQDKPQPSVKEPVQPEQPKEPEAEIIIQSAMGGTVTPAEILSKVKTQAGNVEKIYVKVDENKAYWVKGEENGSVSIWE